MRERNAQNRANNVISLDRYRRFKKQNQPAEDLYSVISDISRKNLNLPPAEKKLASLRLRVVTLKPTEKTNAFWIKKYENREAIILQFPSKKIERI